MKQEVVQHGCNAVDHESIGENRANLRRDHVERVDRLLAHDVVEPRQHAHVSVLVLGLGSLGGWQTLPLGTLALFLLLTDLCHVLTATAK